MPLTIKSRSLPPLPGVTAWSPALEARPAPTRLASGVQMTGSEGHPWHMKPRPSGDIGGEFFSVKVELDRDHLQFYRTKQPTTWYGGVIDGYILPFFDPTNRFAHVVPTYDSNSREVTLSPGYYFQGTGISSPAELENWGTIAVDRCKPTNSVASVAQTLAELKRDGVPSLYGAQLWKEKTHVARGLGSEYLNHQFGWAPLVSDIRKFAKAASQSSKILTQFERDAGRQVRRRYEFPSEVSTETIERDVKDLPWPNLPYHSMADGNEWGYRTTVRRIKRKRWFSGAFTYYLPKGDSVVNRVARGYREFDKLYGGVLDPEIIWNLTPWSWATDWVFNTGSVISNLSDVAIHGLVMPYGYMMEETSVTYDSQMTGLRYFGYESPVHTARVTYTVKRRVKASPFGFGRTWDGLDAYQLSILAALGITRKPHH